jgi:hypothetical protein
VKCEAGDFFTLIGETPLRSRIVCLTVLVIIPFLSLPALAQPEPEPKNGGVTIPLELTPSNYLKPVSRAYLLPEASEAIQGNSVQMFLRCFMEQANFYGKEESEKREKWNVMPLKDLPLDKVKDYGGRLISRDMYDAARMTNADWQILYFVRRDGYYTLLPDVQKMRSHASAMKTRVRGQIASGDFDGARRTLKTMFGLARTLENHPTLIGQLVGIAISAIAVDATEEMIAQPGSPNLFWSLSDLPVPFMSLRKGIEGERLFLSADFEEFKSSDIPLPDAMIVKKIESYRELFKMNEQNFLHPLGLGFTSFKDRLEFQAKDADNVKAARGRLIDSGLKAERVNVWSPLHVVLLDDLLVYEEFRDETGKFFNLPYWQAKPGMDEIDAEVKKQFNTSQFLTLVPALFKIKGAQARLDQRLAYLKTIEAIRLHAFQHSGALPGRLEEINLPLPVDPVTGNSFVYKVKNGVATLHGENPNSGNERTNRYYELRIKN